MGPPRGLQESSQGLAQGLARIFPGTWRNPAMVSDGCGVLHGSPIHARLITFFLSSLHHGSLPAGTFPRQNMESQNCQNNKRMIIHRILHSEAVSRKVVHVVRSTMLTPLQNRTNQPPVSGHQVGGDPWMLKLGPQKLCTGFVLHLLPFSVGLCTHHQNDNAIQIPGHSPGVS